MDGNLAGHLAGRVFTTPRPGLVQPVEPRFATIMVFYTYTIHTNGWIDGWMPGLIQPVEPRFVLSPYFLVEKITEEKNYKEGTQRSMTLKCNYTKKKQCAQINISGERASPQARSSWIGSLKVGFTFQQTDTGDFFLESTFI